MRYTDLMDTAVPHLAQLAEVEEVLEYVRGTGHRFGVLRQSYHFTPLFHSPVSADTIVYSDGFKDEWTALYHDEQFRLHDPIPRRTLESGGLLLWKDAMAIAGTTPEQQAYFDAMQKHGLRYGFGVPLYGPRNRTAYASFDFNRPWNIDDENTATKLRSVAQAGHLRICDLIDGENGVPTLSDREQEVITWIARGKSSTDIGTILDISPETVRTYTKRIYEKLDASDRVGATVKALKLGLVTF